MLLQLWLSIRLVLADGKPVISGLVAYFGYFTVLTNIFVALVCTAGAFRQRPPGRPLLYRLQFLIAFVVLGFALLGLSRLAKGAGSAAHEGGASLSDRRSR